MSNTEHVFEGAPDARQAGEIEPSRFRPRYRALSAEEKALHDDIKAKAAELETLFDQARKISGAQRRPEVVEYFADGTKALELAVMWTVKGLTA